MLKIGRCEGEKEGEMARLCVQAARIMVSQHRSKTKRVPLMTRVCPKNRTPLFLKKKKKERKHNNPIRNIFYAKFKITKCNL